MALLAAGVNVVTTMNIQHLESLNDQMREITGIEVRETIPDWVVKRADEIVLADLTPGALLNRLDRGVVYSLEKAKQAKENFFKEPTLAALREMALLQTAHEIDVRQAESPATHSSDVAFSPRNRDPLGEGPRERIAILINDAPTAAALIRRGRRVADYLKAECFAVAVLPPSGSDALTTTTREAIDRHLDFARKLHIETRVLEGEDEAEALVDFAHTNAVTQIFLPRPPRSALPFLGKRQLTMKVVRLARDIQVTVVADRRKASA
jgi:two-component system sensor histidine kinase KdpD